MIASKPKSMAIRCAPLPLLMVRRIFFAIAIT